MTRLMNKLMALAVLAIPMCEMLRKSGGSWG